MTNICINDLTTSISIAVAAVHVVVFSFPETKTMTIKEKLGVHYSSCMY